MSIHAFATYLKDERNYSLHTVKAYVEDINALQEFLSPTILEVATKRDIRAYLSHLVKEGLQERSINRKLSSIQSYYKFLVLIGEIEKLPTNGIKSLKYYKNVQIPISEEEINHLFDDIEFEDSFEGCRDKLILQLLYQTGIRKAELIDLRIYNVDLSRLEIKVLGKRDKERFVPINLELKNYITQYLDKCNELDLRVNEHLLLTSKGKKLYPKLVYNVVNSYLSIVTDKRKRSPHILRHSFASHFLHHGAEINAVKEILGHESLAATQNYTHNDIEQLKRVFNQTHPRESKK